MSGMGGKRQASRWLELAVRTRQWTLDQHAAALRQAHASELEAGRQRERVELAVMAARVARDALLARDSFVVATLIAQAAFEGELHRKSLAAESAVRKATAAAQIIRDDMQHALGERDAFNKCAEHLSRQERRRQEVLVAREADELWLLRCPPPGGRRQQ